MHPGVVLVGGDGKVRPQEAPPDEFGSIAASEDCPRLVRGQRVARKPTMKWRERHLWWKFSLRAEDLQDDQMSDVAMWTKRRRGGFGGGGRGVGCAIVGFGRQIGFHHGSRLLPSFVVAWAGQSVVAQFGKTAWKNVLHKSADEVLGAESYALQPLCAIVAIAKGDAAVHKGLQTAVGDGDSKRIAGQVSQNLLSCSRVLTMHDPGLCPRFGGCCGQ